MLRNYLHTALRNFLRHPVYSVINISGLVLGLTCSIFIFLWIWDELNYDHYHPDNDRVFKLMENHNFSDGLVTTEQWTSGLAAEEIKSQLPEVAGTARIAWSATKLFKFGEKANYEFGDYADESIFQVLNLSVIEGDKNHPLPDNHSVAISKKLALRYFNKESAIGKTFRINNKTDATVTAVFEDLPDNTTETFEFLQPFDLHIQEDYGDVAKYDGSGWQITLVKLKSSELFEQANEKVQALLKKTLQESSDPPPPPFLFPMTKWRLYNNFVDTKQSGGRINYVISFGVVAVFILLIACINFMNLSTARSANRSREVGIRKVSGASRPMLIRQFMIESLLLSFLSLFIALLLVHLLLPVFNDFAEKQLIIDYSNPLITLSLIGFALFSGIIAGSYPAFFLSSFKPASVLKGQMQSVVHGSNLRKVLVVFQFGLSVIIIVSALVVYDQISFMRNKNLGFDQHNVLSVRPNEELSKNYEVFRNEVLQNPAITSIAMGAAHPMEINGQGYFDWQGKANDDDSYFNIADCDYDYLKTLGFTLIEGRNFSRDFPADSNNYIITEEVAKRIGVANPIGFRLKIEDTEGEIIGVIKDFHNLSIHEAWHPTVLFLGKQSTGFGQWASFFIRYEEGKLTAAMDHIRAVNKKLNPNFPVQFDFVDQQFEKQFKTELMIGKLSLCFTIMAIIISCLGLFGLASFSAERRAKEIGVRKVLGASVSGLVILLCRDFTRLIIYAILLGSPLAYYLMEKFLSEYPYHTQLSVFMFIIPAAIMLVISLSIISYQSIVAALGNPVDALRNE